MYQFLWIGERATSPGHLPIVRRARLYVALGRVDHFSGGRGECCRNVEFREYVNYRASAVVCERKSTSW